MASNTILLIGTHRAALAYALTLIRSRGHDGVVLDVGTNPASAADISPEEVASAADISPEEVANAGGSSLDEIGVAHDRGYGVNVLSAGARRIAGTLKIEGMLGIGDADATAIATAVMRSMPIGLPKLMLTTEASGNTASYIDVKDITMMHAVVAVTGLNRVTRRLLSNAVGAICGMVEQSLPPAESRPLIAATMFGVTTPCVTAVRAQLERAGYGVLVFHATGTGGRAMEALIEDDYFVGVVDVTTTEWADEVVGGMRSAGPDRLGAAGRKGIPQVVSVGALDMVNFFGINTVPSQWRDRLLYRHNPNATLMRTTAAECAEIGRRIAEQLNQATGQTVLILPLRGVSAIDAPGQPFYDAEADNALFDSLRRHVHAGVRLLEVDAHINDVTFADRIAEEMLGLLRARVAAPTV